MNILKLSNLYVFCGFYLFWFFRVWCQIANTKFTKLTMPDCVWRCQFRQRTASEKKKKSMVREREFLACNKKHVMCIHVEVQLNLVDPCGISFIQDQTLFFFKSGEPLGLWWQMWHWNHKFLHCEKIFSSFFIFFRGTFNNV